MTLTIDGDNNVFFAGKTKSKKHTKQILPVRTDVSITENLVEEGAGTIAGFNVSIFDDTGKRLGSVVVGLL